MVLLQVLLNTTCPSAVLSLSICLSSLLSLYLSISHTYSLLLTRLYVCSALRVLIRALLNTVCPSAVLRAAQMDKLDPEEYCRRMERWNHAHARTTRPSVCVDNPGLEEPNMGSVVCWTLPQRALGLLPPIPHPPSQIWIWTWYISILPGWGWKTKSFPRKNMGRGSRGCVAGQGRKDVEAGGSQVKSM